MISLASIRSKVLAGDRLTAADGMFLFESPDLLEVGALAAIANGRKNGDRVYYNVNRHINYTNVCANRCGFCAFRRDADASDAFVLGVEEVRRMAADALRQGATEIHMVGGLHPDLPFSYYLEMLQSVKSLPGDIHLKAFTAVEIDYFSRVAALPVREVLSRLMDAGLGSLPGGGAEIFAENVRSELCADKISGGRWLEIMGEAHRLGLRSNATMLYGHRERYRDRVDHMERLRSLQDETGGFQAFVPLPFQRENTRLNLDSDTVTGGVDDLKTIAVARLFLDNFANIKAYWVMQGEKIAQVALSFGANDLDGTVIEEKIGHEAGADSPSFLERDELLRLIRMAGKVPMERDSLYRPAVGLRVRGA